MGFRRLLSRGLSQVRLFQEMKAGINGEKLKVVF